MTGVTLWSVASGKCVTDIKHSASADYLSTVCAKLAGLIGRGFKDVVALTLVRLKYQQVTSIECVSERRASPIVADCLKLPSLKVVRRAEHHIQRDQRTSIVTAQIGSNAECQRNKGGVIEFPGIEFSSVRSLELCAQATTRKHGAVLAYAKAELAALRIEKAASVCLPCCSKQSPMEVWQHSL